MGVKSADETIRHLLRPTGPKTRNWSWWHGYHGECLERGGRQPARKRKRVGLLKIRLMRPFPEDEVAEALKSVPHTVVIDRAVSPGRRGGISYIEVASCLSNYQGKLSNYVVGGNDVDIRGMTGIVEECLGAKEPFFKWWGSQFEEGPSS